jgi:hypothetical protein
MLLVHELQDIHLFSLCEPLMVPKIVICVVALMVKLFEVDRSALDGSFDQRQVH